MAAISVAAFFGLGKYVPLIELLLEYLDPAVEAIFALISIGALVFAWRPVTDEQVKGAMVKKEWSEKVSVQSGADKRQSFFNY
jgi:hypothetical protein